MNTGFARQGGRRQDDGILFADFDIKMRPGDIEKVVQGKTVKIVHGHDNTRPQLFQHSHDDFQVHRVYAIDRNEYDIQMTDHSQVLGREFMV